MGPNPYPTQPGVAPTPVAPAPPWFQPQQTPTPTMQTAPTPPMWQPGPTQPTPPQPGLNGTNTPAVPPQFAGRFVNDIREVRLNEVPMDGSLAFFPTQDLNSIFVKAWNSSGNLITVRYVVDPTFNSNPDQGTVSQSDIVKRLEQIERTLAAQQATNAQPKRVRKGDEPNG